MADPINILELFAGHGMLGEGVKLARPAARCVGYVEREAYAASCLMARMEDQALEPAPVFCGDIHDVDGREFRDVPGLWVIGGFPCQPFSVAGAGRGTEDERALFFEALRIAEESAAAGLFLENVPGLISTLTLRHRGECIAHLAALEAAALAAPSPKVRWYVEAHRQRLWRRLLGEVGISSLLYYLCELGSRGWRATWGIASAEECGLPHQRERVFVMAHRVQSGRPARRPGAGRGSVAGSGGELADHPGQRSASGRLPARPRHKGHGATDIERRGEAMANAEPSERGPEVAQRQAQRRVASGGASAGRGQPLDDSAGPRRDGEGQRPDSDGGGGQCLSGAGRTELADASNDNRGGRVGGTQAGAGPGERGRRGPAGRCADVGYAVGERPEGWSHDGARADQRLPFPPGPADAAAWGTILADSPHLAPAVEPGLRVLVDGVAVVVDESRADQLRGTGNGVVALTAALAFEVLAERLGV